MFRRSIYWAWTCSGTCRDTGTAFRFKWFPNDGTSYPEIIGNRPFRVLHDESRCILTKLIGFPSCSIYFFPPNKLFGLRETCLNPLKVGKPRKKTVLLYRSTRLTGLNQNFFPNRIVFSGGIHRLKRRSSSKHGCSVTVAYVCFRHGRCWNKRLGPGEKVTVVWEDSLVSFRRFVHATQARLSVKSTLLALVSTDTIRFDVPPLL